eukprot:498480-Amphidinium_carterae.1
MPNLRAIWHAGHPLSRVTDFTSEIQCISERTEVECHACRQQLTLSALSQDCARVRPKHQRRQERWPTRHSRLRCLSRLLVLTLSLYCGGPFRLLIISRPGLSSLENAHTHTHTCTHVTRECVRTVRAIQADVHERLQRGCFHGGTLHESMDMNLTAAGSLWRPCTQLPHSVGTEEEDDEEEDAASDEDTNNS